MTEHVEGGVGVLNPLQEDQPQHECGVVAIHANAYTNVGHRMAKALFRLQHRGQESAGGGVYGTDDFLIAEEGLVKEVFPDVLLSSEISINLLDEKVPDAHTAIGQVRWSTSGDSRSKQPFRGEDNNFMLGHNGEVSNIKKLAAEQDIETVEGVSDTYLLMRLIDKELTRNGGKMLEALHVVLPTLEGGFGLVISDGEKTYGIRDPWGLRPLVVGETQEGDPFVASEDWAFENSKSAKDVLPGQIVIIDDEGVTYSQIKREAPVKECVFERIYFGHAKTKMDGRPLEVTRYDFGKNLAEEDIEREKAANVPKAHRFKPDYIVGVPKSGKPSAEGYADGIGAESLDALVKTEELRSFIEPTQARREEVVTTRVVLREGMAEKIKDKIIVAIDDSLVYGTTAKVVINLLREAGAAEVHLRITSPPTDYECKYGVAIRNVGTNLAAHERDTRDTALFVDADSLSHLSQDGLAKSIGKPMGSLCMACIDGKYPIEPPEEVSVKVMPQRMVYRAA
jgi:amidophosphoribosyltransferase